jgi:hypothetical protein
VFVLTAAFDTLDNERRGRQPLGLFGRIRAAAATQPGPEREAAERGRGWRSWARSVLRFHGRGAKG